MDDFDITSERHSTLGIEPLRKAFGFLAMTAMDEEALVSSGRANQLSDVERDAKGDAVEMIGHTA